MHDKLIKGLSGLGGAAALTTGGVFLKNHISRSILLKNYDDAAKRLDSKNNSYGMYFLKTTDSDDFWELTWILEVITRGRTTTLEHTKAYMESEEKIYWDTPKRFDDAKKAEVDEQFPNYPYWQKYREVCYLWNPVRDENSISGSGQTSVCYSSISKEVFEARKDYLIYKKLKEKGDEISLREFFWTLWKPFDTEKDSEIQGKNGNIEEIWRLFEEWKTSKSK